MRLLERQSNGDLVLRDFTDKAVPAYAILSHTWSENANDEVSFHDFAAGSAQSKAAWTKITFCADRAAVDGLDYSWIDTCCIKRSSDAELSEALNSMFRWYQRASKCYAYFADVRKIGQESTEGEADQLWEQSFRKSRWFTRGWTLQELLAPSSVEFFDLGGIRLGDKRSLERQLHEITKIPIQALRGAGLSEFTVSERMSWAEGRRTKREEDGAYSLLGMFNIHIPLIYGEGKDNAFKRLRDEIEKSERSVQDSILLDMLPYAADAPFNAYQRQHEPVCLTDTRVDLLKDIYDWVDNRDERLIFWLNGLAGTGKSTIARTVARNYFNKKRLGASFFFSRNGGDINQAGRFVTTIAVQLAKNIPDLRRHVCDAIRERSDSGNRTFHDQWDELVLGPLSKMNRGIDRPSYMLIVDALDECAEESDIRTLIHLFLKVRPPSDVRLRIFLTSRPELPIRYEFSQMKLEVQDYVLHNISSKTVDHDIYRFLHYNLGLIRQERQLDVSWPGETIIQRLVTIASGLFIWAATACRFIREGRRFAHKRLQAILQGSESTLTAPEKHLDEIYNTVLRQTISAEYTDDEKEEVYSVVRQVLGSIATLFSPLCVSSLSSLIHLPEEDTKQTLDELHSILDIPRDQSQPLRLHHPSFREFLLNKKRCTDMKFQVDEREAHRTLVNQCLEIMSQALKSNICGLKPLDTSVADVSVAHIQLSLPSEVQYPCLYWVQHLKKSESVIRDEDQVHIFLQKHFLHWLEAMTWMRKVSEAIHAIDALRSLTLAHDCPQLAAFVHDAWRFVLHCHPTFEKNPLQLYCSALLFAPEKSVVRNRFQNLRPPWIERPPSVRGGWNALLQTLEPPGGRCHTLAFSSNSKLLLAASSYNCSVTLWDTISGVEHLSFRLEGDIATAAAFSLDDQTLALGTSLGMVSLRDTITGLEQCSFNGHQDTVEIVIFSSNHKLMASGSSDKTVKLWDLSTRVQLHTLSGHEDRITAAVFLPDNLLLATASGDKSSVKLWDIATGSEHQTLGPFDDRGQAVVFSPDGKILATRYISIIKLWDVKTGNELQAYEDHEMVESIAISPGGDLLASASFGTATLWRTAAGSEGQIFDSHRGWVYSVAFSADGKMLASTAVDETIKLWDTRTDVMQETGEDHHKGWVNIIKFSFDGKLVASASHDNTVKLWDTTLGIGTKMLGSHDAWISDMTFSSNGELLASAGGASIKIWDTATGVEQRKLQGHVDWITHIALSPDGNSLASISIHGMVKVWDVMTGAERHTIGGQMLRLQSPLSHTLINGESVDVEFVNESGFDIMSFWIDGNGIAKYYWTLKPEEAFTQQTFVGHFWRFVVSDTKETIGGYCGTQEQVRVVITNADVEVIKGRKKHLQSAIESLNLWVTPSESIQDEPQTSFGVQDNWITDNHGRRLIWLPDEHRPTYFAVNLKTIVLGQASGQVSFIELDCTAIP